MRGAAALQSRLDSPRCETRVAAHKQGLLPISQHSLFPLASLAYHD
ncbi:MAG: hypothetical protein ACOZDY_05085 [Pseudomonadota bacterium]